MVVEVFSKASPANLPKRRWGRRVSRSRTRFRMPQPEMERIGCITNSCRNSSFHWCARIICWAEEQKAARSATAIQ